MCQTCICAQGLVEAHTLGSKQFIQRDGCSSVEERFHQQATLLTGAVYTTACHLCFPFAGPIPESLSQLGRLEELWLNGNSLNGSIPDGLGYLSRLRELYLNANELEGSIPSSFSKLTNLEGLNVSWNRLSGGFPACLGSMVSHPRM